MAGPRQWIAGARPRTLPAAIAPVAVGTGVAAAEADPIWWRAGLALVVALALQVGVNYANDYGDGVRGTDDRRTGPTRLVASGAAAPGRVRAAAFGCFAVAAVAGLVLVWVTTPWLIAVGFAAIAAAWLYTGGPRPYGYRAGGELAVFLFFGIVCVTGTAYVQLERLPWLAWAASVPVGLLICAILVVNNLRDIPTDAGSGKRTLAVVLGDRRTRILFAACIAAPFAIAAAIGAAHPFALVTLLAIPLAVPPARAVLGGATGARLIPPLGGTGLLALAFGLLFAVGLAI
jgi:1,4-dihydroxy-2-naphthoate octaprenyltransferase